MASRKEYEMLFQLDAKLGGSYTSTFSKAKSGPSELQKMCRRDRTYIGRFNFGGHNLDLF